MLYSVIMYNLASGSLLSCVLQPAEHQPQQQHNQGFYRVRWHAWVSSLYSFLYSVSHLWEPDMDKYVEAGHNLYICTVHLSLSGMVILNWQTVQIILLPPSILTWETASIQKKLHLSQFPMITYRGFCESTCRRRGQGFPPQCEGLQPAASGLHYGCWSLQYRHSNWLPCSHPGPISPFGSKRKQKKKNKSNFRL